MKHRLDLILSRAATSSSQSRSATRVLDDPAHREARLVFLLAGPSRMVTDASLFAGELNWSRLLQIAWEENALGALRDHCRLLPMGAVQRDEERRLACLALQRDLRMRKLETKLEQSLAVLDLAGIEVMLLKGAALAPTVYGSFAQRSMNDIDLLVDPLRAIEAHALMQTVGWEPDPTVPGHAAYTTHHHLPPLRDAHGTDLRVEIHRELLPVGNPFRLGRTELWGAAREVRVRGHRALVPHASHHALHLAIHFAWSHMMRSGAWHAFRDMDALDQAGLIDWNEIVALAQRAGASSCAYWMLRLGRTLANLSVPYQVIEQLAPPLGVAVLDRIERHLVHVLFRRDASHLSARVERALWSLAIRPRALGHGEVRPWLVSRELATARSEYDGVSADGWLFRHATKLRSCSSYLASLMWA